ncbi:MAG: DUF3833 domain-containing protein [Geminicoccaceae bacterium]
MRVRHVFYVLVGLLLLGCSGMKPEDFAGNEPEFRPEIYFEGHTRAWGMFQDRFGKVRRQFVVDLRGTQEGDEFVLREDFVYEDGETQQRVWRLRKTGENTYEGRAADVVGVGEGVASGNAFNLRYDLKLPMNGREFVVHFDDWMFLQPDGVLLNRATASKYGFTVGHVTLAFTKVADVAADRSAGALYHPSSGHAAFYQSDYAAE